MLMLLGGKKILPCAVKGYAWAFLWAVLKIAQYEVR